MDALIFAVTVVALAAFVARPLYAPSRPMVDDAGRRTLATKRDALIAALRELEVDHASGLVADDEYAHRRDTGEAQAAALIKELASHAPSVDQRSPDTRGD